MSERNKQEEWELKNYERSKRFAQLLVIFMVWLAFVLLYLVILRGLK